MLDYEYRKKREAAENKRDWVITSLLAGVALLAWSGIVAIWKYIGHDGYIIVSVILPLSIFALILTLGALNGNRRAVKDVGEMILSLVYFWP